MLSASCAYEQQYFGRRKYYPLVLRSLMRRGIAASTMNAGSQGTLHATRAPTYGTSHALDARPAYPTSAAPSAMRGSSDPAAPVPSP